MSTGKFISLEEVRKNPKLLKRFIKQRQSEGDLERFEGTLDAMIKNSPQAARTSPKATSAGSSGTRTRRGSDGGT